jgi:molecular chaperone GrpE (heat shock protein)
MESLHPNPPIPDAVPGSSPFPQNDPGLVAKQPGDGRTIADLAEQLTKMEQGLSASLAGMQETLAHRTAVDTMRERQIERMQGQLEEHNRGGVAAATRALLHGLLKLREDVVKRAEAYAARPEAATAERLLQALREVPEDIDTLLSQHGVTAFREPGDRFEARRQTAALLRPTERSDLVGTIADRLRPGYEQGTEILQKERVEVWAAVAAPRKESLPTDGRRGPADEVAAKPAARPPENATPNP